MIYRQKIVHTKQGLNLKKIKSAVYILFYFLSSCFVYSMFVIGCRARAAGHSIYKINHDCVVALGQSTHTHTPKKKRIKIKKSFGTVQVDTCEMMFGGRIGSSFHQSISVNDKRIRILLFLVGIGPFFFNTKNLNMQRLPREVEY